jgi:cell division septal protein FtsQ
MPDYKRLIKKRKRKPAPKTDQEQFRSRGIFGRSFFFFAICTLCFAAILGLRVWLTNFSGFNLKHISVVDEQGRPVENPQDFLRRDQLGDAKLFNLDIKAIVADIQARHPQLHTVSIRKHFPNRLLVVLKERCPIAIIELKRACLVDAEGVILPFQSGYTDLPRIIGVRRRDAPFSKSSSPRVEKALTLLAELKKAKLFPKYKVAQINMARYRDVIFYLQSGIEVKMGENDFTRKTELLGKILAELTTKDRMPQYIDMRFEDPSFLP